MSMHDVNSALANLGGSWLKLKAVGDSVTLVLSGADVRDKMDMGGKPVVAKKSGKVRKEIILSGDHKGEASKLTLGEGAQSALKAAMATAGASNIEIGAKVTVTKTGEEDIPGTSFKYGVFSAVYASPTATGVNVDDIL